MLAYKKTFIDSYRFRYHLTLKNFPYYTKHRNKALYSFTDFIPQKCKELNKWSSLSVCNAAILDHLKHEVAYYSFYNVVDKKHFLLHKGMFLCPYKNLNNFPQINLFTPRVKEQKVGVNHKLINKINLNFKNSFSSSLLLCINNIDLFCVFTILYYNSKKTYCVESNRNIVILLTIQYFKYLSMPMPDYKSFKIK